jgi:hypothetical protein
MHRRGIALSAIAGLALSMFAIPANAEFASLDEAQDAAREAGKLLLLDFYTDW